MSSSPAVAVPDLAGQPPDLVLDLRVQALYRANDLLTAYAAEDAEKIAEILTASQGTANETILAMVHMTHQMITSYAETRDHSVDAMRAAILAYSISGAFDSGAVFQGTE